MSEGSQEPGVWGAHDPAVVLRAVVNAIRRTGDQALLVLSPVRGPRGEVQDFTTVVDTGLIARLAGSTSVGHGLRELLPAATAERIVAGNTRAMETGEVVREDLGLTVTPAGVVPVFGAEPDEQERLGEVVRVATDGLVVTMGRDVTEARRAERALAASEQRYRRLVEHSSDPIVLLGRDGAITYASPAVRSVLHRDPDALVGKSVLAVTHPDDAAAFGELFEQVRADPEGGSRMAHLRTQHPAGDVGWISVTATNWLADPAVGGVVVNIRDITEQRAAEQRLQQEALQDALTGLPNRRWFLRALQEAASRSSRSGAPFAVLLLDVDDFKRVNDSLGHPAGDELLAELARRLSAALRPSDTAARLGGDEFVVIAEGLHGHADAATVAGRILARCAGTYRLANADVPVTVSVGVATTLDAAGAARADAGRAASGASSADPQRVLTLADSALYEAKRRGRNRVALVAELPAGPGAPGTPSG